MAKKLKAGTTEPKHKDKWTMINQHQHLLESEAGTQWPKPAPNESPKPNSQESYVQQDCQHAFVHTLTSNFKRSKISVYPLVEERDTSTAWYKSVQERLD